jgi:dipeptidyl aminopeptidase/acylaminoacyl peptidase
VRLTSSPESETRPRFSPDGRYLSFLSSRGGKPDQEGAQVFLLERAGGEAQRLTEVEGGVSDYTWSPDGRKLALVVDDPDPEVKRAAEAKGDKKPKWQAKTGGKKAKEVEAAEPLEMAVETPTTEPEPHPIERPGQPPPDVGVQPTYGMNIDQFLKREGETQRPEANDKIGLSHFVI